MWYLFAIVGPNGCQLLSNVIDWSRIRLQSICVLLLLTVAPLHVRTHQEVGLCFHRADVSKRSSRKIKVFLSTSVEVIQWVHNDDLFVPRSANHLPSHLTCFDKITSTLNGIYVFADCNLYFTRRSKEISFNVTKAQRKKIFAWQSKGNFLVVPWLN